MKSQYVEELKTGQIVKDKFILTKKTLKEKKDGGFYTLVELTDRTGTIEGIAWDSASSEMQMMNVGDCLFVSGNVNEYNERLQVVIQTASPLSEKEISAEDFLPRSRENIDDVMSEIISYAAKVEDLHLKKLLELFFGDMFFTNLFRQAPAAKKAHHAYLGGLAVHTRNICRMTVNIPNVYPFINMDLLVSGVLLHDIGKIHEYTYDWRIDISTRGRMIGHIIIGYEMVKDKVDKIPHFPEELCMKLLHMILSHHGEFEYGSPKQPVFPEALFLHFIDNLDSKMDMMHDALRRNRGLEKEWSDYHPFLEREIYLKEKM